MLFEKTIVEEIIKLWRCTMFENPKKCLIWIITSNWNLDFMLIFSAKNIYFAGKYKDHLARKYCEVRLFEWFSTILRNDSLGKLLNWLLIVHHLGRSWSSQFVCLPVWLSNHWVCMLRRFDRNYSIFTFLVPLAKKVIINLCLLTNNTLQLPIKWMAQFLDGVVVVILFTSWVFV